MKLEEYIRNTAGTLGFGAVGFGRIEPSQSLAIFQQWLAKDYCAEMHYLKRHAALRSDPRNLAPQAKSIIVVGTRYPSEDNNCPISNYARGTDYHDVLRAKLEQLSAALDKRTGCSCGGRICVDSAPLPEREWAVRAGIGWIGKQGSVVSPELGCCFFLGELMVDIELEPSAPLANQCQDCRRCIESCPTRAIMSDNLIDARRCISYLTVEHKKDFTPQAASLLTHSVFGCDRCTSICPFNRRTRTPVMAEFKAPSVNVPTLEDLARMNEKDFKKQFGGTPVEYVGWERFQRNVKTVLDNQKKEKM